MKLRLAFGFDTNTMDPKSHRHSVVFKTPGSLQLRWGPSQSARGREGSSVLASAAHDLNSAGLGMSRTKQKKASMS
jgi:hypothetical protein